jgi:large subunit ribosomal protein L22
MQSRFARFAASRATASIQASTPTPTLRRHISTAATKQNTFTFQKLSPSGGLQRPQAPEPTFQLLPQRTSKKAFSTEAAEEAPQAIIENLVAPQSGFVSRALRTKAKAKYKNLPISPHKLRYLCKLIRGMNVREAIIQLRLCSKRKSYFLRRGIRTLANSAVNTFNMTKDRLIVSELSCTRGVQHAKVEFRARGRVNLRMNFRTHLYITLAEQPYHPNEIRIGRYGRTIDTWKKFDKLSEAWKLKRAEENGV